MTRLFLVISTVGVIVFIGCTSSNSSKPTTNTGAATTGPPYQIGGDVKAPLVLKRVEPKQPPGVHETGTVLLRAVIGLDGVPRDIVVLKTDSRALAEATEAAFKDWRFQPGTLQGEPVEVFFHLTMTFH